MMISNKLIHFPVHLLIIFTIFGCCTVSMDSDYQGPEKRPDSLSDSFPLPDQWRVTASEQQEGFTRVTIEWEKHAQIGNEPLTLDFYRADASKPIPAILVAPIMGGHYKVASNFAGYFSQNGYHAVVIHRPEDLVEDEHDPSLIDQQLKQAVIRDRVALEWLLQQEGVDADRVGSFGISYGGIKNVILAGIEPRLNANVFGLAGADLASIIMTSTLGDIEEKRQEAMEHYNWTPEEAEQQIRSKITMEPLRFAPYIDAETTFLILAYFDRTVPFKNGQLLRESLGGPKTLYLPLGHFTAALLTDLVLFPYVEWKVVRFFDEHLKSGENGGF